MAEVALSAEVRAGRGKNEARRLRASGKVPGILYGHGMEPVAVAVNQRELGHTLSTDAGRNVLIDLHLDGKQHLTLARELDRDPIRGTVRHVDFLAVDRNQAITMDIPIHFEGDSAGVREGGVLEHHLWQLQVECTPTSVPDNITIDVSNLVVGQSVHVWDVSAPEGVTILSAPEEIIVSCVVPQLQPLEEEAPEAEAVEGEAAAEGAAAEGGEGAPGQSAAE